MLKSHSLLRKSEPRLKREGIGLLVVNEKTCKVKKIIKAKLSKRKFASIKLEEIDNRRKNRYSKYRFY